MTTHLDTLRQRLPEHARDLRLNLSALLRDAHLTDAQRWGALLACAHNTRQPDLVAAVEADAAAHLSPEEAQAARTASALMAMNNVYYRSMHLMSDPEYARLPAGLRMQGLARPGAPRADFELWCLAVSAMNGCAACLDSHERSVRKEGLSKAAVQQAIRVAAVVQAVAVVLDAAVAGEQSAAA